MNIVVFYYALISVRMPVAYLCSGAFSGYSLLHRWTCLFSSFSFTASLHVMAIALITLGDKELCRWESVNVVCNFPSLQGISPPRVISRHLGTTAYLVPG